ncbi:mesenteric estrogen-dependent adipogenesis protein-like [Synchiropus splendidus]|uniref:mesenteric estrogen-dependent adipogenesis protein-like n=1 Tax=Synchiropus splendidus TaxID=270530 RepID=UPI00237ED816|nr:mesenteric estrogen-dependent adipogenesis protein-like [Synchiropus splendidus]
MTVVKRLDRAQITITELGEFLRSPPAGFSVDSDFGVHFDPERDLVLINDLDLVHRGQRVVFHKSLGRKVKVHNLLDYTQFRRSLLSKRIYLRVCERKVKGDNRELKQYVVCLNGGDPFIRWQLERALDWTISSVAGESYRLEVDVRELLDRHRVEPGALWSDASFTLKYYSDALFDFPHWFGFSKRRVQLRQT